MLANDWSNSKELGDPKQYFVCEKPLGQNESSPGRLFATKLFFFAQGCISFFFPYCCLCHPLKKEFDESPTPCRLFHSPPQPLFIPDFRVRSRPSRTSGKNLKFQTTPPPFIRNQQQNLFRNNDRCPVFQVSNLPQSTVNLLSRRVRGIKKNIDTNIA